MLGRSEQEEGRCDGFRSIRNRHFYVMSCDVDKMLANLDRQHTQSISHLCNLIVNSGFEVCDLRLVNFA